jgi:hypothetical protein
MSQPTVAQYLKYAHLQMAAEAFIRDESNPNPRRLGLLDCWQLSQTY